MGGGYRVDMRGCHFVSKSGMIPLRLKKRLVQNDLRKHQEGNF